MEETHGGQNGTDMEKRKGGLPWYVFEGVGVGYWRYFKSCGELLEHEGNVRGGPR